MNPYLILGYDSVDKITGIVFIAIQEILRNIKPRSFFGHQSTFSAPILPRPWAYPRYPLKLFALPQNLCPLRWRYTSQVLPPVTHNQVLNGLYIFISDGIFGAVRPFIILNALSPTLKFCSPLFHRAIRRKLIPKCFHEVFVNFLGSHFLLTKIFYHRSYFNFLHFASLTHYPLSILSKRA